MKARYFMFILAVISILILSGCTQKTQQNNQQVTPENKPTSNTAQSITIESFKFNPETVTIKKGSTVTWINKDSAPHTATSQNSFDSGTLSKGQTFTFTFKQEGTFNYICSIHPYMKGKIIVE